MSRGWDKTLNFLENYGMKLFMLVIFGILIGILLYTKTRLNNFMVYFLEKKEGTFVNIAAIFIGISFAIFTILGSTRPGSIISRLKEENLQKLIKFLRNGLFGGFIYIFLTLFFNQGNTNIFSQFFNIVLFLSLIYMLLSSLRFGMYLVFVIYDDVNGLFNKIKDAEKEEKQKYATLLRLESFLDDYEDQAREKRAQKLSEMLNNSDKTT